MRFKNPQNEYVEIVTTGLSWLWVFLWTPFYYAFKGIWFHAAISFMLFLLSYFFFGFFGFFLVCFISGTYAGLNNSIVRKYYLRQGWLEVDGHSETKHTDLDSNSDLIRDEEREMQIAEYEASINASNSKVTRSGYEQWTVETETGLQYLGSFEALKRFVKTEQSS